ncbi:MAG: CapA family protein [Pseudomonadota bacterium]
MSDKNAQHPGAAQCVLAIALLASVGSAMAQSSSTGFVAPPYNRDRESETRLKISAPFTVAAAGDIIMPQPLMRHDAAFLKLIERIRSADVGFGNMESSLIDFRGFKGVVHGTLAPFSMGESIKAMGFNLMNRANNHAFDGGVTGMSSTDEALDKLGIVHAGSGSNLQDARGARFMETPKGRVGLVGMFSVDNASNYGPSYTRTLATSRHGNLGGGPGVNPLHLTRYHIVSAAQLESMQQTASAAYGRGVALPAKDGAPARLKFFDEWFQAGSDPGSVHYEIDPADLKDILESVRNGKVYADFLIVNIHAHQTVKYTPQGLPVAADAIPPIKEGLEPDTPAFLVKLAHESIDNGADMFIAHGPHTLRGVEIYKGKPIFYGLSNFVFQFGLQLGSTYNVMANERKMAALENEASQEAVLATSHFENGKLAEVRLYPADLGGARRPISQMGIPLTPEPGIAQRILKGLQASSREFGTTISIENNVGVIRTGDGSSSKKSQ